MKRQKLDIIMQRSKNEIIGFLVIFTLLSLMLTNIRLHNLSVFNKNEEILDFPEDTLWKLKTSVIGWATPEVVSIESTDTSYEASIATDSSGNIHVVWLDVTNYSGSDIDADIFYKRWNSTIKMWSTTQILSAGYHQSSDASIAVDNNGNIHLVWSQDNTIIPPPEDDIFYRLWNATLNTWSSIKLISTESTASSSHPSIAVDDLGDIHIVWEDITNYGGQGADLDVFYKRWDSISDTWTITEVVSIESSEDSHSPSATMDNFGNLHVVWYDYTNYTESGTDCDIFYKLWNATTQTWTTTEVVSTESIDNSYSPKIKVDVVGNKHVVWPDSSDYGGAGPNRNIFYKRWNVTSLEWSITEVVSTNSTDYSNFPSIALDSEGNVHLVWQDGANYYGSGDDDDIYYRSWNAMNDVWTNIQLVSIESTEHSLSPSITIDNVGTIHVAWHDKTNFDGAGTDYDIFYRRLAQVPDAPLLDPISPNPDGDGIINLNWNDVSGATEYFIYRNSSVITYVYGLEPIANSSLSNFQDTLVSNGSYYYCIVAGNLTGKGSASNCESVEVIFPPNEPFLDPITPNPNINGIISLNWSRVVGATKYYVYRDISIINSVVGINAIATVVDNNYTDTITITGDYYYTIVAGNNGGNSSISNCESITVNLPTQGGEDPAEIPSYDIYILISVIGVASIIFIKKKKIRQQQKS